MQIIDSVGPWRGPNGDFFKNTPLAPSGTKIVYSGWGHPDSLKQRTIWEREIGIYDRLTREYRRLAENGIRASWSPSERFVSYINHDPPESVAEVYDLKADSAIVLYTPKTREEVDEIWWTPSGEYAVVKVSHTYGLYFLGPILASWRLDYHFFDTAGWGEVSLGELKLPYNADTWRDLPDSLKPLISRN